MSSQVDSTIEANAEAGEILPSPVSPLSPTSPTLEAQEHHSPIATDHPDMQQDVSAAHVLPDSAARTYVAHGSAHVGSGIRESQPEAGPVVGENAQAGPAQNLPASGETNVEVQSVGERPTFIDLMHCSVD